MPPKVPKQPKKWFAAKPAPIDRSTGAIASRARPRMAAEELREVAQSRLAAIADTSQPVAQDVARQTFDNPNPTAAPPLLQNPAAQVDVTPEPWQNPANVAPQREIGLPDPWDSKEGYYQPDLFGGGETIKQAFNPPPSTKNPNPAVNENFKQPFIPGLEPKYGLADGAKWGWNHAMKGPGENGHYSRSFIADTLTNNHPDDFRDMGLAGKLGATAGRMAGDVAGYGSRHYLWNIHPEDMTNTIGRKVVQSTGGSANAQKIAGYAGSVALGLGAMNYNPLNFEEGGRQKGYAAVSPTDADPRQSENAALDLVVHRGLFGRTGRLLPWEQFKQERPDVSYEKYAGYQEYLRDPGLLNLAKGTLDGVDGPEARIMGYRVTPGAVGAAAATIGGIALLSRPRMARMFK